MPRVSHSYKAAVEAWHKPGASPAKTDSRGRPFLVLEVLNTGERIEVQPQHDAGRFSASDLDRIAYALRDQRHGNQHPFDPQVIDLIYDLQVHFKSQAVRVISGYRTPSAGGHSNHGRGRAVDLIIPGAADEDVAKYVRAKGFVGVGVYPTSGFLHVDVRPVSYYWVDRSGPGQRNCERSTLPVEARQNDAQARTSGRRPPSPWSSPSPIVDAVWRDPRPAQDLAPDTHVDPAPEEDDLDPDP